MEAWRATALDRARIEVFDDLFACEALWRRATPLCACTVFQTYDWLAAWRAAVAEPGRLSDAIVHVSGADGATLLLLPLGISPRLGGRCLEFLGGDQCDYNAPVIDRALAGSMSRGDVERLWPLILARLPRFDWLSLRRMPPEVDGVANPFTHLDCITTTTAFAARLPHSFEAYVERRSRSFFAQNRRHLRRLDKVGTVTLSFPEDREDQLSILRFAMDRKALWQGQHGFPRTFHDHGYRALYERVTRARAPQIEPVAAGLYVGGTIVAGLWGVIFRGRFLFLITSYDADWSDFRVGRLLMEAVIRFCIARKLEVFDLTTGEEAYKTNWADTTMPMFDHVAGRTVFGHSLLGFRRARQALRSIVRPRSPTNTGRRRPAKPTARVEGRDSERA